MPAYPEMLDLFDAFPGKLKAAKNAKGLTNAELADLAGVPVPTVNKQMVGALQDPKLYNTVAMCKVTGLSLDRAFELVPEDGTPEALREKVHEMELGEAYKDAEIMRLKTIEKLQAEQLKIRKTSMLIVLCLCALLTVALVAYIIIDSGIPDAGLIRLGDPTVAAWAFIALVVVSVSIIAWGIGRYARSE